MDGGKICGRVVLTYERSKVLSRPTVLLPSRSLSTRGSALFIMSDL